MVGSNNTITECLFEDLTWLGTLDFPAIEIGFGDSQPTQQLTSSLPTVGNDNRVLHTTVRRVGEMGILTSQRSNEIAFTHVHHTGLIGLDSAALHADNTWVFHNSSLFVFCWRVNTSLNQYWYAVGLCRA